MNHKFYLILFWIKVNITCNEGYKFSDDGGTEKSVVCEQSGWVYPQGYTQNNFPACDGIYTCITAHNRMGIRRLGLGSVT